MGCTGGNSDDSDSALKQSFKKFRSDRKWDLVIIDECHNCFNNYCDIRADRVMLLTATPIVINSKNIRNFGDYKNLMKLIIGDNCWNHKIPVDKKINPISKPLFDDNDIFVCNYKEDIFNVNINRKIKFILCERTENRKKWFNKLRYTKDFFSAMYADQDDFRLSEKMKDIFNDDLCDYNVGENKKLEKLIEIINGDGDYKEYITKSIIVFCEMQATVDMIYNKMVGLTDEKTIIGKKYGEVGEIQNITTNPNIVLERLKNHIRLANGNRSILITTGKSAGTGLNLGEFNTVIHYELPYTSNELEQRFGRIERADDLIRNISNNNEPVSIENEMIFLINQASDEDSDFETNRMLYYAINKINIACQYMPMRNTVLFHPEFTKRLKGDAEKYFVHIQEICNNKNDKYNLDEYIKYKKRERTISEWIRELKNLTESEKNKIESAKDVKSKIDVILNDVDNNNDIIEKKDELDVFCKMESHDDVDKLVNTTLEYVLWLKNALKFYGIEFNIPDEFEDYEEIAETITEEKGNADTDNKTRNDAYKISISNIQDKIISEEILLDDICKKVLMVIKSINEGQNATGIFYFDEDKKFCNKLVSDFRRNSKEKSV
jgi:DNA or RNA helicases of superfamily II